MLHYSAVAGCSCLQKSENIYFYEDYTHIHTYYARMGGHDHVWDRRYTQACTRDLCLCQLICKLVFASGAREPHSSFLSLTIFGPARLGPSTNTWDSFDPGSLQDASLGRGSEMSQLMLYPCLATAAVDRGQHAERPSICSA